MPKMKTRKAAAKRFKATGTGKFKRAKCNKQHILGKKTQKRKRRLRKAALVNHTSMDAVRRMLPYA